MATKIKPDYQPSKRAQELLAARFGLTIERAVEFSGHEHGAFMLYWEGTGKAKTNWDSTWLNWMCRSFEDKKEQMARHRPATPTQGNIFEQALQSMDKQPEPVATPRKLKLVAKPIPGEGETMSADQALDMLAQMRARR